MILTGHKSARDMLEMLASYLKEDHIIQEAVMAEFGWKPSVRQIALTRKRLELQKKRFSRPKWDKGGNGENDKIFIQDMETGSARLRDRIVYCHPQIMRALEARGNMVVWHG